MKKTKEDKTSTRKPGGQRNNFNSMRHGLLAGKLPQDAAYVEKRLNVFRRHVEKLVVSLKGDVSLTDAACINSACRWERHAILCNRFMHKQGNKLSPADFLKYSESLAKASDARDKALARLNLDKDHKQELFDSLYADKKVIDES